LTPLTLTPRRSCAATKGQEAVERRCDNIKGPLAVAPMFLKNNRRIEAPISVICPALLIFCLPASYLSRTTRLSRTARRATDSERSLRIGVAI
jgi:transposase